MLLLLLTSLALYYYYPFGADLAPIALNEVNQYRITAPPAMSAAQVDALIQNLPKGVFFL